MNDHDSKLKFILAMTKHGLEHTKPIQHFDSGGTVTAQNTNSGNGLLGGLGSLLGTQNNFQAASADIKPGTTMDQLNKSYADVQNNLALQGQQAEALNPQLTSGVSQQNMLAQQLMNQANGTGPNVAQNQLNQATAANTANQAALMAGQRGASANTGLLARQAAMQGAANQQQAAGQAATLGAQQQIAAQNNLAGLSGNQINQATGATGNLNQASQNEQNILQQANTSANNAAVGMQSNINNTNSQAAQSNQNSNNSLLGGIMKGASAVFGGFAEGGEVTSSHKSQPVELHHGYMQMLAQGGSPIIGNPLSQSSSIPIVGPSSFTGQWLSAPSAQGPMVEQTPGMLQGPSDLGDSMSKKKKPEQTTGSPGDLPGQDENTFTQDPNQTGMALDSMDQNQMQGFSMAAKGGIMTHLAAKGGKVKAQNDKQKAVSKSDSYSNDKIPALLSEGEIVIDLDALNDKGAVGKAARFLRAHYAKKGLASRKKT